MTNTEEILKLIINYVNNKKIQYLKVLDIRQISDISDYFVIISLDNIKSVNSITDDLIDVLLENNITIRNKEGINTGWVLLDLNDIIIHIFNENDRKFYDLERNWADASIINYN